MLANLLELSALEATEERKQHDVECSFEVDGRMCWVTLPVLALDFDTARRHAVKKVRSDFKVSMVGVKFPSGAIHHFHSLED